MSSILVRLIIDPSGLHGNLSILTKRYILTKADDPLIKSTALADLLLVMFSIAPVFVAALQRQVTELQGIPGFPDNDSGLSKVS